MGAASDADGLYTISKVPAGKYTLRASYVGYVSLEHSGTVGSDPVTVNFSLKQTTLKYGEIIVEASRAKERETPVAFTNVRADEIQKYFTVQDVPHLFQNTPGVYVTSEGGSGLGDSKVSIRGFDEQRISVMINNIETNDPESKKVYWSNWGSLPSGSQSIQLQRGAGSSLYGAGAFGGSINILTADAPAVQGFKLTTTAGRYGTYKLGLDYNTGLINDKYAFVARVNYLTGNGWRRDTYYQGLQYYFSFSDFISEQQTLRVVLHGAPQYHSYSYYSFSAKDLARYGRDYNPHPYVREGDPSLSGRAKDGTSLFDVLFLSHNGKDKGGEVIGNNFISFDNNVYHKPQFEVHHTWNLNKNTYLQTTSFFTIGRGYGENIDGFFRIKRNGLTPGEMTMADITAAKRYQYRNYSIHQQVGLLSTLNTKWKGHELSFGAEGRYWSARHYGLILNTFGQETISYTVGGMRAKFRQGDVYYDYTGIKPNFSFFGHALWKFGKLSIMTDAQLSLRHYDISEDFPSNNNRPDPNGTFILRQTQEGGNNDGYVNYDTTYTLLSFTQDYNFFAPKFGLNYNVNEALNVFANYSRVYNEPRVKYFYNFGQPNETLPIEQSDDFELGFGFAQQDYNIKVNLYQINFAHKSFRLQDPNKSNQPGYDYKGRRYVTVGDARYRGIELAARAQVAEHLTLHGSVSKSKNAWTGNITHEAKSQLGIDEGKIEPQSPQLILAGVVDYVNGPFSASGAVRYFDDYYILADNEPVPIEWNLAANAASVESATLPSWTVTDVIFGYRFNVSGTRANLSLHVMNLFDAEYFQIGDEFGLLPGAERNVQVNLSISR